MLLSEGQMSDFNGAALMIGAFPKAKTLLGDKGYDADWFRNALADQGITACIPSKANRKVHNDARGLNSPAGPINTSTALPLDPTADLFLNSQCRFRWIFNCP